jgi:hypothetical protein
MNYKNIFALYNDKSNKNFNPLDVALEQKRILLSDVFIRSADSIEEFALNDWLFAFKFKDSLNDSLNNNPFHIPPSKNSLYAYTNLIDLFGQTSSIPLDFFSSIMFKVHDEKLLKEFQSYATKNCLNQAENGAFGTIEKPYFSYNLETLRKIKQGDVSSFPSVITFKSRL